MIVVKGRNVYIVLASGRSSWVSESIEALIMDGRNSVANVALS